MDEMVERAARALCRLQCERNRRDEDISDAAIERAVDCAWWNWTDEARVALEAIRDQIHQAAAAERSRCIAIARDEKRWGPWWEGQNIGFAIAAAIERDPI